MISIVGDKTVHQYLSFQKNLLIGWIERLNRLVIAIIILLTYWFVSSFVLWASIKFTKMYGNIWRWILWQGFLTLNSFEAATLNGLVLYTVQHFHKFLMMSSYACTINCIKVLFLNIAVYRFFKHVGLLPDRQKCKHLRTCQSYKLFLLSHVQSYIKLMLFWQSCKHPV